MVIPITCIDNFYDDPDRVRDFALSLDFFPAEKGYNFPGERTDYLSSIDSEFYDSFCKKLLSLFFDFNTPVNWVCETSFQKTYPYHKDINSPLNTGWAHLDNDYAFAGVIYLNPNPNINSGTTILTPKKDKNIEDLDFSFRNRRYHNENLNEEEYSRKIQDHNDHFDIGLDVKNKYNRLICYNHETWHKESNFCMDEGFRLTQIFFIREIYAYSFPNQRMRTINSL